MTIIQTLKKLGKFNIIFWLINVIIQVSIGVSAVLNFGRFGYNDRFLLFAGVGAIFGLMLSLLFLVFSVINVLTNKNQLLRIMGQGAVAENPIYKIFSSNTTRLIVLFGWTVVVAILASGGLKIWAEPAVYAQTAAFAVGDQTLAVQDFGFARSLYDTAVIPAWVEDFASYGLSWVIVIFILLLVYAFRVFTKSDFFKIGIGWITTAILVACPIAAAGLGFIPGFAQAHEIVAGQNFSFFVSAWFFQTINLYVFWTIGLIFPIAHLVHNSIFLFGFATVFSIAFMLIPIIRKRKNIRRG